MKFYLLSFILIISNLTSAFAQLDGRGHPGKVQRIYVKTEMTLEQSLIPGSDHEGDFSDLYYNTVDITPLVQQGTLKVIGQGLQSRKTGESLVIACIGAQNSRTNEASCDYLRAVYYNPIQQRSFAFGTIYYVENQDDLKKTFKSLKTSWQQIGCPVVKRNYFLAFYSQSITNTNGWNWSISDQKKISHSHFLSLVEDIQDADKYWAKHEPKLIFSHLIR